MQLREELAARDTWYVWVLEYGIAHQRMRLVLHGGDFAHALEIDCTGATHFAGELQGGPYRLSVDEDGGGVTIRGDDGALALRCARVHVHPHRLGVPPDEYVLRNQLKWSVVSLFCVTAVGGPLLVTMANDHGKPDRVTTCVTNDPRGWRLTELDADFAVLPWQLSAYLTDVLRAARDAGCTVAWLGIEGSFHFDDVLTEDIASSIYGIVDADGLQLALDAATRGSAAWRDRLRAARGRIVKDA